MAETTNIKIITSLGQLAYRSAEDLGIVFNRIVDDMTEISNRFQDFSYEFELPYVKQNSLVFGSPESKGSTGYYPVNQNISCQVYLNNEQLLDGLINLEGLTKTGYKCKFYSKFKELVDILEQQNPDGTDKTLRDLKFPPILDWSYEDSVITHINANYYNSDETFYQYPLMHFSTFYTEFGLYSGLTENISRPPYTLPFRIDYAPQNFYYMFNNMIGYLYSGRTTLTNRVYIHQVPPALYLVSVLKQILSDAGWKLGGQFFDNKDIKRIILCGGYDDDCYDQAIFGKQGTWSGSTDLALNVAKFLPEMSQAEFLQNVINLFNLYVKVDVTNKIVDFQTYNTLFGDSYNPYDITSKVKLDTLNFYYEQNNDPTMSFGDCDNVNIMGDNYVMSGASNNATTQKWIKTDNRNFKSVFNRKGSTDEISVDFVQPNMQRIFLWNDMNIDNTNKNARVQTIYLPCQTKATPQDNGSVKFAANTGDTYLYNNEQTIKYASNLSLYYYYGRSKTNFVNKTGVGALGDFMWYYMYTNTGTTANKVPIHVVSPMQLFNYRGKVNDYLSGNTYSPTDRRSTTCTYLQSLWHVMGKTTNYASSATTEFSLTFDDSELHQSLWTTFHKDKWNNYKNSECLEAEMRMNPNDWREMQIERPIKYNNEIYNIIAIEGYNPISRTASIKLIKKQ